VTTGPVAADGGANKGTAAKDMTQPMVLILRCMLVIMGAPELI
tara:strand:+ start:665 stop:793 length:129 start_codon:yes stop_codon:yes gene_type:complete